MNLSEINNVLLDEKNKLCEGGVYTINGKKGVWRTVRGRHIFFPKDGSGPIGMPKAMKRTTRKKNGKVLRKIVGSVKRLARGRSNTAKLQGSYELRR